MVFLFCTEPVSYLDTDG